MTAKSQAESLSIGIWMYALVTGITSVTLPIIDALCDKSHESKKGGFVEHEPFLEVYHLIQYISGFLCLVILLIIVCHSSRRCRSPCCGDPSEPKKTPKSKRQAASFEAKKLKVTGDDKLTKRIAPLAQPESSDVDTKRRSRFFDESTNLGSVEDGVNLYLRLGALGFGFGVMIYDGFKVSDRLHSGKHNCSKSLLWIPKYSSHFLFVFIQTFLIVKHHCFKFTRCLNLVHFCLVHLIVTNFGQWFKIVVYEITGSLGEMELESTSKNSSSHGVASGGSNSSHNEENPCVGLSQLLGPFLFPCVIEYSLIACAICYRILEISFIAAKERRLSKIGHDPKSQSIQSVHTINKNYSECHKAHKGLFVGLFLFMATIVSMAIFFLFSKKLHSITTFRIYQITESSLLGITLIGVLIALCFIRSLRLYRYEVWTLDVGLLSVGYAGVFVYDLMLLVPAVPRSLKGDIEGILYLVTPLVEMVQTFVQYLLIIESERRCASTVEQVRQKPGRTVITCLLIANLALWLVNTFEVKYIMEESFQAHYYDETAWNILTRILLPLLIFYRFHSSVCLSRAWSNVYQFKN